MIDTDGPYLLILILQGIYKGGIATEVLASFDACKAVLAQLDSVSGVRGYCVAATVR